MVRGTICVLGKIDVKPFCIFNIYIVGGAEKFDLADIVAGEMELGNIEVFSYA